MHQYKTSTCSFLADLVCAFLTINNVNIRDKMMPIGLPKKGNDTH